MALFLQPPSGSQYVRHRPERGLLYRTVETYWPVFLRERERVGKGLPHFIRDEFDQFLCCGIPEFGFVRTYCRQCRKSGIVAFSCKKRGFCPSCCSRRMNDTAAHIVDHVVPEVPLRQWVLSFPYGLRFQMAHSPELTNQVLRAFIQTVASFQRKRAKQRGIGGAHLGSITFIQRFGSALNLNVHFHSLVTDGVFRRLGDGEFKFVRLPEPSQDELLEVVNKIQTKVQRLSCRLGFNEEDQLGFDEESLGDLAAISIAHKAGFGDRLGRKLKRYGVHGIERYPESRDPYSVNIEGFSLNARVWIAGRDRMKVEKLIRYMSRGPIATERLSQSYPNLLLYRMKTPWRDGTTHVSFSPLDFIARLVALIPPPKMNLIRYHGVFAPNFKGRQLIVPKGQKAKAKTPEGDRQTHEEIRRERMRWSDMLKRTFKIDVTVCPRCKGRVEQI
ncbi:MAG: transposase, partial [Bdellovibrionales bacterium]|nr:transposase [Bdellovibrionales bacterium]